MVAQVQGHEHLAKEILVWIILQGLHQQGKQPWENLLLPLAVPVDSSYVLLSRSSWVFPSRSKAFEMVIAHIATKSAHTSQLLFLWHKSVNSLENCC